MFTLQTRLEGSTCICVISRMNEESCGGWVAGADAGFRECLASSGDPRMHKQRVDRQGSHLVHIDLSLLVMNQDPDGWNKQVELLDVCPRHDGDLTSINVDYTQELPAALLPIKPGRACC
jgi:hypothetical protein